MATAHPQSKSAFSSGCRDIYDKVYNREKAAGSSELKSILYARVAAANCEKAGKGDKD